MRILLIGNSERWSLENFYLRAFLRLHHDAQLFDLRSRRLYVDRSSFPVRVWNRIVQPINDNLVERDLIARFQKDGSSFDVVIVFKGRELSPAVITTCRKLSSKAKWVNINPDDPVDTSNRGGANQNVLDGIPLYDIYFVWAHRLIKEVLDAGAKRVEYLPFGFDEEMHPAGNAVKQLSKQVLFVGSWDPVRESWLAAVEADLAIFGWAWERSSTPHLKSCVTPRTIYQKELAELTAKSAACINILREQNHGSHNMRTFEVPAMNGLLLTMRSGEQQQFFPDNEASIMFSDHSELNAAITRILSDPVWADSIRRRGHELAQQHTYTERARQVLAAIAN